MSYYIDQSRMYIGMHIKAHGSDKHTVKKWQSEVRRGLTQESYHDWAALRTVAALGLTPAPAAPSVPVAPPPAPR